MENGRRETISRYDYGPWKINNSSSRVPVLGHINLAEGCSVTSIEYKTHDVQTFRDRNPGTGEMLKSTDS